MLNKTDDFNSILTSCCAVAKTIAQHPRDAFVGLPDAPLILPKNILLFSRKQVFAKGRGATHHHRFMLIICLNGEGSVIADDRVVRLKSGYALLITPHQFHHYTRFATSTLLWLFLSFELDDEEEFNFLRGRAMKMDPLQMICLRQLAKHYGALAGKQEATPEITILAALLLERFRSVAVLGRKVKSSPKGLSSSHRMIQDVARYVNAHVAEAIHISDVARAIGFSESHLRARFHDLADIGLGAYIRQLRLNRARKLLLTTELRIQEIAEQCGYDSIYTFSRAFRHEIGTSPSVYRLRNPNSKNK